MLKFKNFISFHHLKLIKDPLFIKLQLSVPHNLFSSSGLTVTADLIILLLSKTVNISSGMNFIKTERLRMLLN